MKILVTGAAGFIGFHLTTQLLEYGNEIIGIDNLNNYYNPTLKKRRLNEISTHPNESKFTFIKADIADREFLENIFSENRFDLVINLAAQAGVRYSLENPHTYIDSNVVGFVNILEGCRQSRVPHLIYASSSSVYGLNSRQPSQIDDRVDEPISLYAATKKSNELMAYSYSHLYGLPTTGLRFFTVYGPYGRPDMAYYKFVKSIIKGKNIDLYNYGNMKRDFTYISDIIECVMRIINRVPSHNDDKSGATSVPYQLYNIGSNNPVTLKRFIRSIEKALGIEAKENLIANKPGDVSETHASIDELIRDINYQPEILLDEGIAKFVHWYKEVGMQIDNQ
tara:strand:- start:11856 stop:12866 length:1011 start_codon:yes stop_codon:yes gene_type:complete